MESTRLVAPQRQSGHCKFACSCILQSDLPLPNPPKTLFQRAKNPLPPCVLKIGMFLDLMDSTMVIAPQRQSGHCRLAGARSPKVRYYFRKLTQPRSIYVRACATQTTSVEFPSHQVPWHSSQLSFSQLHHQSSFTGPGHSWCQVQYPS